MRLSAILILFITLVLGGVVSVSFIPSGHSPSPVLVVEQPDPKPDSKPQDQNPQVAPVTNQQLIQQSQSNQQRIDLIRRRIQQLRDAAAK